MKRPVGVTASAIVAILGSIIALLCAGFIVASLFIDEAKSLPPNSSVAVMGGALIFAIQGVLGLLTAVGLLRLRPWARVAILVFAGFLAAIAIFSLVITMAMPIPKDISGGTEHAFREVTAVMFGIPLAIAVWWFVQFNTQTTKAAFSSREWDAAISRRPLSITVIAWASIVGGASCVVSILAHIPAFVLGAVLTGWSAGVIYALLAALSVYIGKGLLDLREPARILAIVWYAVGTIHLFLITLVPSLRERMLETERAVAGNQSTSFPFDSVALISVMLGFSAIVAGAAIWFLLRNRAAFMSAENAAS